MKEEEKKDGKSGFLWKLNQQKLSKRNVIE